MSAETSGDLRKQYVEDVLGPLPEPQKTMMTEAFDSGIAIGMVAAAEMLYATANTIAGSAKSLINEQGRKLNHE